MMNVPKLRFKGFDDKIDSYYLSELCTTFSGGTPSSTNKKYYCGKIPFIKSGEIYRERTEQFINEEALINSSAKLVVKGDILYALYGATSGQVAISKLDGAINQAVLCIRPTNINTYYLYTFLKNKKEDILGKYLQGGQGNLSANILKGLIIPFPTLPEQEKIASFFTAVDSRLEKLKKKKELLEQYKKGVMQKIFSQELRFKDDKGNNFPDWEEKTLETLVEIKKGVQLNVENMIENGLYPAINGGIKPSGYTNKWNVEENTITISEGGNSCGFVNFMKEKFWSGGHNYTIQNISLNIHKLYLFHFLKYNEIHIMRMRVGSGLPNIQKKSINTFNVIVPSLLEQQKIADFLTALDKKIDLVSQQISQTELWKKGLLQQMFV